MHSVAVRMQLAHTPLGARGAAAAVLARGRVEDARSDHGAQSRMPQHLAPEAPSSVVWACEAAGEAGHRARRGHWHWHWHWHWAIARARVVESKSTFGIDLTTYFWNKPVTKPL